MRRTHEKPPNAIQETEVVLSRSALYALYLELPGEIRMLPDVIDSLSPARAAKYVWDRNHD